MPRAGPRAPSSIRKRLGQEPRPASAPPADDAILSAMTPDPPGLLEASEMVRRELSADSQDFGDRGGLRVVHSSQGEQDAKADVAVLPMTRVEPIHFGFAAGHVVPTAAVDLLLVEESVLDERVQMVPRGADGQAKRPRDGSEVVPREETQMVVDLSTDRMLEPYPEAQTDQERATSIRQVAGACPGSRPGEDADRPDCAGKRVVPPLRPIHEKSSPRHSFSLTYFKPAVTKTSRPAAARSGSMARFDLGGPRFDTLKSRCRCSGQTRNEFAGRFSNAALADVPRGDDEDERLRAQLRGDGVPGPPRAREHPESRPPH